MFKFFPDEAATEEETTSEENNVTGHGLRACEQVEVQQVHYDIAQQTPSISLDKHGLSLKYTKVLGLINSPLINVDPKVRNILESTSDLQSGEYEGGFKLWECTFDLLSYLEENPNVVSEFGAEPKVLDLGCGHGILGLYALKKYGATVVFQDYNVEVLNYLTIPNTIRNFGDEDLSKCQYFAGSWSSLNDLMRKGVLKKENFQFDVILSSETIYNTSYLPDFIELVKNCLKPEGSLFLAAKTCYFGVGGGTKNFAALTNKVNSSLQTKTVKVIRDGIQREVLQVQMVQESVQHLS